jgi:hypothetical protein
VDVLVGRVLSLSSNSGLLFKPILDVISCIRSQLLRDRNTSIAFARSNIRKFWLSLSVTMCGRIGHDPVDPPSNSTVLHIEAASETLFESRQQVGERARPWPQSGGLLFLKASDSEH